MDRLNTALADRYRIERELGQGGMATVHLTRDLRHDQGGPATRGAPVLVENWLADVRRKLKK